MIEFATNPEYPFRAFDDNIRAARKNEPATPFEGPCKYFAGAFYCRLGASICSATARRGGNRSESCFIWRYLRKKSPNSNPKAESAPISLFFPVISRRFPFPNPYFKYQCYASRQNCAASRYLKVFEPVYCCFKPHIFCPATTISALQVFARRQCGRHLEVIGKTIIGRVALKGGAAVRRQ